MIKCAFCVKKGNVTMIGFWLLLQNNLPNNALVRSFVEKDVNSRYNVSVWGFHAVDAVCDVKRTMVGVFYRTLAKRRPLMVCGARVFQKYYTQENSVGARWQRLCSSVGRDGSEPVLSNRCGRKMVYKDPER